MTANQNNDIHREDTMNSFHKQHKHIIKSQIHEPINIKKENQHDEYNGVSKKYKNYSAYKPLRILKQKIDNLLITKFQWQGQQLGQIDDELYLLVQ